MAQVQALRPCVCGKPGIRREMEHAGEMTVVMSCDECLDESFAFLDRVRPVFAAMLAVGVPHDIAGETMGFLLAKVPNAEALETTALMVLAKCNERGEVGYAQPLPNSDAHDDWDVVQECLDKGWLVYGYDASPDIFSPHHGQMRTVYHITAAGREVLQ